MKLINLFKNWIKLIIFVTFFQYGLFRIHGNRYLNEIDDVLLVLLFLTLLMTRLVNKKSIVEIRKSRYDIIVLLLLVWGTLSSVLNQVPFINYIVGLKNYFLFILLLYCITWVKFSKKDLKSILNFSLALFIIQFLIAIYQLATNYLAGTLGSDVIYGTFNDSNYFGYAIFILLYFALYNYYFNKDKFYFSYLIILGVLMILSSARYALLMFPLVFIFLNPIKIWKRINLKIAFGILALMILFYLIITQQTFISSATRRVFDYYEPRMLIERFTQTENEVASGSARNLWYPLTAKLLETKAYSPLFGFGLGMYASNAAMILMPDTNLLIYNYFNQQQMGLDTAVDSQIIPIWGELGYVGLILVYCLLFIILFRMIYIYKHTKDNYLKSLASASIAYTLFFIIGFYVHHILESQTTSILLFLFVGITEKHFRIEKSENVHEKTLLFNKNAKIEKIGEKR